MMKCRTISILLLCALISCESKQDSNKPASPPNPMIGTWQLVSGTFIQGKDTTVTYYTKNRKFIKIIDSSHFAFVGHDLNKGQDSTANYTSGAGTYTLSGDTYTEHLEFCSERVWEGHDFANHVDVQTDSFTQTGIEKVEKAGVNRLNIEKYVRLKN
jgi:hypothetical protein